MLLRRHYVHYVCTPTRSSVQTGRLPVHVQLGLANPEVVSSGIPRNMTGLPDALRKGGAPYVRPEQIHVPLFATRSLNATGQSRVTLSLRQ